MEIHRSARLTPAKHKAFEPPAITVPKKLKSFAVPIEELLHGEYPFLEIRNVVKLPTDQKAEEILAANRPPPYDEIRRHENVVVELPNAFDEFEFKPYEPRPDEFDDGPFKDADEERNYQLFIKEFHESEGFDVEHYCYKIFGALQPLDVDDDSNRIVVRECRPSVETAIRYVNYMTGSKLELERIIKCNFIRGTKYFATCRIKDTQTGVTHTYQVKVQRRHCTGKTTIHKFRKKPSN